MIIKTTTTMETKTTKKKVIKKSLRQPRTRKFNRKRVEMLTDNGIPPALIAKDQKVACSTITRYLKDIKKKASQINWFSSSQLEILKSSQLDSHMLEERIKQDWLENITTLLQSSDSDKKEILKVLQGGRAYDFDKQRLLEGKSTNNTLSLHVLAVQESGKKFRALQSDVTTIDDSNTE